MIAFTICSNSYLPEALTLGDSLRANNLDPAKYFIFLVDEFNSGIDYDSLDYQIIQVNDLNVPGYSTLAETRNIIELCTSVKPSLFKYLITVHGSESIFSYFDPDLYFCQDAEKSILEELDGQFVLLTPHITQPVPLDKQPFENTFLNYGIYNLGFITLKVNDDTFKMLNWWEERTLNLGIVDTGNGYFVDQLWMNLAPLFFDKIKVTKHLGFNVAYWNLNEREVREKGNLHSVNGKYPLVFLHFSAFDFTLNKLSNKPHSKEKINHDHLAVIASKYKDNLIKNDYAFYKQFKPISKVVFKKYMLKKFPDEISFRKIEILSKIKHLLPVKLLQKMANLNHILEIINKIH